MGIQVLQKGHSPPEFRPMSVVAKRLWFKMPLDREEGLSLGDIAFDGDPAPRSKKGVAAAPPPFCPYAICCGKTAGWINMPLGTEVGLSQATLC